MPSHAHKYPGKACVPSHGASSESRGCRSSVIGIAPCLVLDLHADRDMLAPQACLGSLGLLKI